MKTQQATVAATFEWGKNQQLVRCRQVSFTMPVAGLSSSIEAMDKNYLNAMEANKYKEVAFSGGPCAVSKDASGKYVMHYPVSFSIHGRQKQDTLHLWGTFSKADSAFSFTGSHRIKMSDFGIAPPTFMQGSVTTGDAFEVHFNTTLQKQPQ
jgi:polyisoprenoid-binding protein YceI